MSLKPTAPGITPAIVQTDATTGTNKVGGPPAKPLPAATQGKRAQLNETSGRSTGNRLNGQFKSIHELAGSDDAQEAQALGLRAKTNPKELDKTDEFGLTPLMIAAEKGGEASVKALADNSLKSQVDFQRPDDGLAAVHVAAFFNQPAALSVLIDPNHGKG